MMIEIVGLIGLLALSAFFSAAETAFMSISIIKARTLFEEKRKGSRILLNLKHRQRTVLIAVLIGNNSVNIASAAIATIVFTHLFGSNGIGIATGVMTFMILIFGEIIPKSLAARHAEAISLFIALPLSWLCTLLFPFIKFFESIAHVAALLFKGGNEGILTHAELKTTILLGTEDGVLTQDMAHMMSRLLEFDDRKVSRIMTPKRDISFVNGQDSLESVIDHIIKSPFSKFPVYLDSKEHIVGILHDDDALKTIRSAKKVRSAKEIARKAWFIPQSKDIADILPEFQKKKTTIFIVIDEYGSVVGVVTLADILAEIFGDPHDKKSGKEKPVSDWTGPLLLDGRAKVRKLEKLTGLTLSGEHFNTIGGFMAHRIGSIPLNGTTVEIGTFSLTVKDANEREIIAVILERKDKSKQT